MKTKYWILVFAILLVVCAGLSIWALLPGEEATMVEVRSEGELLYLLPLSVDREVEVVCGDGVNVVTVKDGKVAVTQANCPDGYCMKRGFCSSGVQIVCLPNHLVLSFVGEQEVDAVIG